MSDLLAELVELEMKQGCREERRRAVVASLEIYARDLRGNSMGKERRFVSFAGFLVVRNSLHSNILDAQVQKRCIFRVGLSNSSPNCINNVGVKKTGTIYEGIASESVQNASRDFERSLGVNTSFGRIGNSCESTNKYASRGSP